jgi:hypothetical protein
MHRTLNHKIHVLSSLFLLTVLLGSILVKPIHILLVHHDLTERIEVTSHEISISNSHQQDCAICDFEFCTFIPQSQISIPQMTVIVRNEQTPPTVDCFVNTSTHLFQLRAPPTF